MKRQAGQAGRKGRRAKWAAWCLMLGVALTSSPGRTFQPLVTDDTGTQGTGGNQLEGGFLRATDKHTAGKDVTLEAAAVYTRGIYDTVDVFIGLPYQRIEPAGAVTESGWSNAAIGAKWRFFEDEKSKLSFALKPVLQLPVSSTKEMQGLGTARTSWRLDLLMTQETGFGAVHANLASSRVKYEDSALNDANRQSQFRLSVAPVWDVTEKWKLALDAGIMTNPDRMEKQRMGYYEIGAIYAPSKDLELALGVIRNTSDGPVESTQVTAGVTWRFK